jgi:hypothetical protein
MSAPNVPGVLGATNDASSATPLQILGTVVTFGAFPYTYARATAGAIAPAGQVALTGAFGTTTGTTYTSDVPVTIPLNDYFWAKKVASPF